MTADKLTVRPATLCAWRESGQILSIDQLSKNPDSWLRRHGVFSISNALPLVLMLDQSSTNPDGSGTVAWMHDDEQPLQRIDQAIAALRLAREALVKAGHEDFRPGAAA